MPRQVDCYFSFQSPWAHIGHNPFREVAKTCDLKVNSAYEINRLDAMAADVFGSPGYVLDGEVFRGQDRIDLLADALKSGRAPYRSQV
jgi:2-hydroxychromene-2-carboxylate isomerase